jgi:hypothetical protein
MLAAFVSSPVATPDGELLGIEEEVRGPLHPELPEFTARLDLLLLTPDALVNPNSIRELQARLRPQTRAGYAESVRTERRARRKRKRRRR